MFPPWIFPTSAIRADDSSFSSDEWAQFDPVSKVFLTEVSGKRVPYKCVNGGTSKGLLSLDGGVSLWKRDSHLRRRLLGIQV